MLIDAQTASVLADWWHLGWRAIDMVCSEERGSMAIQLWPEHFDAGTSVAVGASENDRCNLGASPGDSYLDEPYLYVGPWSADRPGDPSYWNAPFGAVLTRTDVLSSPDPHATAVTFMRRGLQLLR